MSVEPGCPVGETKDRNDVHQGEDRKEGHQRHMHCSPPVECLHRQRIPEQLPVEGIVGRGGDTELLLLQLRLVPESANEMLPDVAACRYDHHERRRSPGKQRIEMDAGMDQYQERSDPACVAVQLEKAFDRTARDDLFFPGRIDEREQEEEGSGNPEVPAGRSEPEMVKEIVERHRGDDEEEVGYRQGQCFPDQEGLPHGRVG